MTNEVEAGSSEEGIWYSFIDDLWYVNAWLPLVDSDDAETLWVLGGYNNENTAIEVAETVLSLSYASDGFEDQPNETE